MVDNQSNICPVHAIFNNEIRRELDDHKCSIDRHWDEINGLKEKLSSEIRGMQEWARIENKEIERKLNKVPWILLGMVFQLFLTAAGFIIVLAKAH